MSQDRPSSGSLGTSFTMLLIGAGRVAQRRLEAALAEHDLTLRHIGALGHLGRAPELSYSDLARRAGVTAQSMHATIAGLVERGAITATGTSRGQRAQLRLTDHGQALLDIAADTARRLDATFDLGNIDVSELQAVLVKGLRPEGVPDVTA